MLKILIIDDESEIRDVLNHYLRSEFTCQIDEAGDGINATYKTLTNNYDLIISDFKMPNYNGGQLLETLRKEKSGNSSTKFIFFSGYIEDAKKFNHQNQVFFISKPSSSDEIISVVRKVLNLYN